MTDRSNGSEEVPVLRLTEGALATVSELRAEEDDPESLALCAEISGMQPGAFTYELYFQAVADVAEADWVGRQGAITVVVPATSVDRMRGSILDVSFEGGETGMVIRNPNPPQLRQSPMMAGPPPELTGDVAERVHQILEWQINPAIAAHGGRAELVAVEEEIAYLRLSGGCAGCGLAAVTLSQGIEVAIREAVPEIERIVDVTDHAAGTNPYFEAAKK
jgi:Fe/S biogenesis protein NfuA